MFWLYPKDKQEESDERERMKKGIHTLLSLCLLMGLGSASFAADPSRPPNVLVIMIDDLNDWVGCLGGHPGVKTPNMDRLASRGMLFSNAHAQAVVCGPSRISLLSGRMPQTTGARDFKQFWDYEALVGHNPLPLHFKQLGYTTYGSGKVFHKGFLPGAERDSWDHIPDGFGMPRPDEPIHVTWHDGMWDWGPIDKPPEAWGDYRLAVNMGKVLRESHDKPFFIMAGLLLPHVPMHAPQEWFDRFPLEDLELPEVRTDDLDDVPNPEIALVFRGDPTHETVVEGKYWKSLVQAYLASTSFADHCVGRMLDALENGPNKDNTIVVLLSDHGFHLGEKQHWAKRTLWEESTRVPLIISGPGIEPGQSEKPVGLIDLYPTLCELTSQPTPDGLDGHSLLPLLRNPGVNWPHPAYTTYEEGDLAVRTEHWRYIRNVDGGEELYDHRKDPNEWTNLASNPEVGSIMREHRKLAEKWK